MALRVDELELPSDGPIGPVRLSGLAQVDMVVITGPNGAGKTMLVRPLEKPGPSTGRVVGVDASGARAPFAVRGKGVEQSITFVTSADLMAKFRSLKEPLALAANVTREAHQQALLEQVASALRRQSAPAAEAEPAEIRVRRAAFLEADRRCGQAPRTLAEYDRLGQALASAAGKPWRCPPLSPDSARVAVESALQPEFRALAGLEQALPALKAVGAIAVPDTGPNSRQAARADSEAKLVAALAAVVTEVPGAAVAAAAPVDRAPLVRAALAEARSAVQRTIEAMGRLEECRRIALEWLRDSAVDERARAACPVCEHAIDAPALEAELRGKAGIAGSELAAWTQKRDRLSRLDAELQAASVRHEQAAVAVRREHEACAAAMQDAVGRLRPATGWAPQVRDVAAELHDACNRWLSEHGRESSAAGIDGLRTIRQRATARVEELTTAEHALNAGLEESRESFRKLQSLGSLLMLREELDAIRWSVSVGQLEADQRREAQRAVWIAVLGEMSQELQHRQQTASEHVVNDAGVQGRFRRLLDRVARTQPVLAKLEFRGDHVEADGTDRSDELSEGQRVLVNIAAVIAVVGKVAGTPTHLPGWIAFDEPTNGLDDESREAVAAYLGSITVADLPSQVFVTSFERRFAERLAEEAARNGRRVRLVELPPFVAGQPVRPVEKEIR